MKIEVLTIDECPNSQKAIDQVHIALKQLGYADVPVVERRMKTSEDAAATAFAGSPTILIDGVDIVPGTTPTSSLACRVYLTETGMAGCPNANQIAAAIHNHA